MKVNTIIFTRWNNLDIYKVRKNEIVYLILAPLSKMNHDVLLRP